MPPEATDAAETDETPVARPDPPSPPAPGEIPAADEFDRDRAMATIKSLRAFEKDAKAKLKRLEDLEKAENDRKAADLTEAEKLRKDLASLTAQHEQAQSALRQARVKDAVRAAATALKLDFQPGALDDAVALGLFVDLEIGDDGRVKGLNEHIKELAKEKPYLFATAKADAPADIGATRNGKQTTGTDPERLAARFGIRTRG